MSRERLVWLAVVVGLVLGVLAAVLLGGLWVVLAVVPPIALNAFVRSKARKVRNNFAEQLPENLDVLASALRAGHSLAGAMGVVADEAPEPSKREFTRIVTDEALGIPLDEALEVTAKRMQSTDMDQVAVLALVQREAGGNTAEVLDEVTKNIRARMDVRRLVEGVDDAGQVLVLGGGRRPRRRDPLPHARQPRLPRADGQHVHRPGGVDRRGRHGRPGLLRHPTHRRDRALNP